MTRLDPNAARTEAERQRRLRKIERDYKARYNGSGLTVEPVRSGFRLPSASAAARPSYLYVVCRGEAELKVGFTQDLKRRLAQLQSASARTLTVYASEPVDCQYPQEAEARAHSLLWQHRIRGEWFRCHPEVALAAIRRAAWEAEDGC